MTHIVIFLSYFHRFKTHAFGFRMYVDHLDNLNFLNVFLISLHELYI